MPFTRRFPRLTSWIVAAIVLIVAIALMSPQQLPVSLYKLSLVSLAAVVAYWLDRGLFPYARPDSYLQADWRHGAGNESFDADYKIAAGYERVFAAAMLRRALIVVGVVIGVALGL
ncbi:hypothetical protein BTM_3828 [Burkholderia thailandensis 34]|uniref:putative holin n=1 Tax=Burkholderia thailandensis TaxID=57975 RepID=UPI0005D92143|nr:putative holin [Burkholderia thailandensis]AJY31397.1 hypothetical protein BTM_3828 [Burkholderia thailandensis 34]AOJ59195.1 hypothetical protein AQ477_21735 [Burkholderia thailandensis]KXF58314.1 hypothetical protein AQ476_26850 [Burkholderia thailandensis]PNE76925.1 hypothetical protein A8H37_00355 [Burkholderia thailandensis]